MNVTYFDQRKQTRGWSRIFQKGMAYQPNFLENHMKMNQKYLAGSPLYPL